MKAIPLFDALLRSNGIPIDGVAGTASGNGTKPPDLRIDFQASATAAQISQAQSLASSFNWLDQPDPNVDGFMDSVIDAVNSGSLPAQIIQHVPLILRISGDSTRLKALYAKFKASAPAWMTAANYSAFETAAANANMPVI
ncbi:MAG: hypothetical protein KGL39_31520 [Patescibacteria group bacterium]|nr:hypothetical protein [Patescibacteria group bacterium]